MEQNFKNHNRWVPGYHFVLSIATIALLIGSIMNVVHSTKENLYSATLLVLVAVILLLIFIFLRTFPLKAQDRAIVAEEKLRYFILTGKPLSNKLTTRQIIGLRFASDDEFVALASKAEKENLSEKAIKLQIKNWKADNYRV